MNRYPSRRFRPVLGAAAVVASALVLGLAVYLPVKFAPAPDARVLARLTPPIEVAINPSRIDVILIRTVRTAENAFVPTAAPPRPKS